MAVGFFVGACGSASSDGSGIDVGGTGTGGDPPTLIVDEIRQTNTTKLDVLFVIDNSTGMADKQALLSQAVPGLIERLVNPDCVRLDGSGDITERAPGPDCPDGMEPELPPLADIHIGVITSSLGGHGGDICTNNGAGASSFSPTQNDRGRLLPTVRPELNLPADDPAGFLAWDPDVATREQVMADFAMHVQGAGDVGCGYEAPLEAWYRFLVDPSPPLDMVVQDGVAGPALNGGGEILLDASVLDQRRAFLRPDSVVVIAMLSDENDCSIVDKGIGWWAAQSDALPPATSACDANPNDPCCRSCGLTTEVAGCPPLDDDANCQAGRTSGSDALNLRCYNQKQRLGFDLLYPIERYVAALKDEQIYDTHRCDVEGTCPLVQNPLFDPRDATFQRDPSQIYLAGIVGVPWQDIVTEASLSDPNALEFLSARELAEFDRWEMILGHPEAENPTMADALPQDPLMIERTEPRTGTHPITAEAVAPETSTDPSANSINGHEFVNEDASDLQYACIFPLPEARDCEEGSESCDCSEADLPKNSPLCNPPEGGEAGTTQYYAKAYPAPRLLQTLRDFGDNAIVASVCPRVSTGEPQHPAFGYNPAIAAIVDRLKESFGGRCWPRLLSVDANGQIACSVVEVSLSANACDPAEGRSEVDGSVVAAVTNQLKREGHCGGATGVDCDEYSQCQINQLSDFDQQECQETKNYFGPPGFCYIDEAQDLGNPALLEGCPATERRKLQFVGDDTPLQGAMTFVVCEPE